MLAERGAERSGCSAGTAAPGRFYAQSGRGGEAGAKPQDYEWAGLSQFRRAQTGIPPPPPPPRSQRHNIGEERERERGMVMVVCEHLHHIHI